MFKSQILEVIKKILQEEGIKPEEFSLEPSNFGDFSTNLALRINKHKSYQTPMQVANFLLPKLEKEELFERVNVTTPGFINFILNQNKTVEIIQKIIEQDKNYGSNINFKGKKARVEFVSANPTGPLHIGNARGGPLGDVIANVLVANGYEVLREYINNDEGNQIDELGKTLAAKAGFIKTKDEDLTYKGNYTVTLATEIKKLIKVEGKSEEEIIKESGKLGSGLLVKDILKDSKKMGIKFDLVVNESVLQKQLPKIIAEFEKKGVLKNSDGAVWFVPKSDSLEDVAAVVVKSDGSYTYFASDIAYHKQKFNSGADLIVDVFGANTSGHVPKLLALAEVENFDLKKLKIVLYQFVRVKRINEIVKMSKREGNFVTAAEVIDEVGKDSFRFFLLSYSPNTHLDFDLELAKKKSSENPVYYVQYAYARMCGILSKDIKKQGDINHPLLKEKEEVDLIKKLGEFPDLVADLAETLAVHQLTFYSTELAEKFHQFYEKHQVITEEKDLSQARIDLVRATKITLKNTLELLGVSAPERM